MASRKTPRFKIQDTTWRHLWLAGLGLAESARRVSLSAANEAGERLDELKKRTGLLAGETRANVRDGLVTARDQGGARTSQFSGEVEARLAPVLAKLGLKPARASHARKPGRKTAPKRTAPVARKPAARRRTGPAKA